MGEPDFREESLVRSGLFPETQTVLLAAAAKGRWDEFMAVYLRPCWNNVVAACRARGLDLHEADDLFQELVVRLISPGRFGPETLRKSQQDGLSKFRGNLAARYLRLRELPLQSAKFRTYLKGVTARLLSETLRNRRRRPQQATPDMEAQLEEWLDESVGLALDRVRTIEVLHSAVTRLHRETRAARTKGRRRHFEYLYHTFVGGRAPGLIATEYDVHRTVVSEGVAEAKKRFAELVRELSDDDAQIVKLLAAEPHLIAEAFRTYAAEIEKAPDTGDAG